MSISFEPPITIDTPEQIVEWMQRQLDTIADAINNGTVTIKLLKSYEEPAKLFDGLIAYAAGDPDWDPGTVGGPAVYMYISGSWRRLDYNP